MTKKRRTGNLYQRGKTWWLKYMVEGRLIRQSLETTSREEAEEKQKEIMRPFMAAARVDAHAIMEKRLRNAINVVNPAYLIFTLRSIFRRSARNAFVSVCNAWTSWMRSAFN
ncbi:MAG: hypothetical protein PHP98_01205 [Kiritimatiellae bacterium]|nr:hypothetical protein [Kiritimatiellia bacterium]